jgi:uncharacterized protein (DUF2141 family)
MAARALVAVAILVVCASSSSGQTPVRDTAKPPATGTGSLTGTIVTDETEPRPMRRVRVGLTSSDRRVGRTTVTDDSGRFSFAGLPAGRYLLSATKSGYVVTSFGARRPNRPGTAIAIAEGQRIAGVSVRMPRGAVITGIVTDQNGEPLSGANVSAMRYAFAGSGQRSLIPTSSSMTDDRGQYRIWGLAAGDYVITANLGAASPGIRPDQDIGRTTDADVKRALAEMTAAPSAAGQGSSSVATARAPSRTVGYATVYYPGTFSAPQATAITVTAGEERAGIDFPLSLVATAKVEGTVGIPEGVNPKTISVQLVTNNPHGFMFEMFRRSTVTAEGGFTFAGVPPGTYTVAVTAQTGAPGPALRAGSVPGPTMPRAPSHWALADIAVDGQDLTGLTLQLQLGMSVSGRVVFEGAATPPDVTRIRVSMMQPTMPGTVALGVAAVQPDATGAFTIHGVSPGNYRLTASVPTLRTDTQTWQLKSATINGRDTLDALIELRAGADDALITFTDKATEVSGTVQDAAGQPAPEYHVVLFSADKGHWTSVSRRIRSVRPGADGKYQVPNLPPGDYLVAAVNDIEPGEWFDPAVLDQLSRTAVALTLGDGEKKVQDLRLAASVR